MFTFPFFRNPKTFIHQLCHFSYLHNCFRGSHTVTRAILQLIQGFLAFLSQFCFLKHRASLPCLLYKNVLYSLSPAMVFFFFWRAFPPPSLALSFLLPLSLGFLLYSLSEYFQRGCNVLPRGSKMDVEPAPLGVPLRPERQVWIKSTQEQRWTWNSSS